MISFINRAGMAIFLINAYCSALWFNRIKCCLLGDFTARVEKIAKKINKPPFTQLYIGFFEL